MKIGLLTHSVNPRGGVVHTLELAAALQALGHQVTVFAPAQHGQRMFRNTSHAVRLVPVGPAPVGLYEMVIDRVAAFEAHLASRHDLASFDIWHAHDGIGGNALANLLDAGRIRAFVRTVHHLDDFEDGRVMRLQRRSVERARLRLCVSPLWRRTLRSLYGVDAELVNNGVDLARYRQQPQPEDSALAQRLGLRPGAPLWLSVGGVEERKNTLGALQAFMLHRQRHPQAQWLVAGGASLLDHGRYQSRFREALQASGLAADVLLAGTIDDADMPALYRLADGLLMPSLREGFGLAVLEALASGTAVVVSNCAPFTEYLDQGDAQFADPLQANSIAEAMDNALLQARVALPPVCLRYAWPVSAARHSELYAAIYATDRIQENPCPK